MPNVGEIVGGSMRMFNLDQAYKKEGLDPSPYYWYTDQRKFGTCPHGDGMAWLLVGYQLYPRYLGRCRP
jgi:asparaginyl-tRNA synthetase